MPELRTRSAGAKVTDKEYAEIEKLAQARGLNVGEWCREVILAAVNEAEADAPTVETLLAEVMALRMIFLNVMSYAAPAGPDPSPPGGRNFSLRILPRQTHPGIGDRAIQNRPSPCYPAPFRVQLSQDAGG